MINKNLKTGAKAPQDYCELSRRNLVKAFAAFGTIAAAPTYSLAANLNRGAGNIRKINMRNDRTGELLDMVYWVEGEYIPESLKAVNYFFRDWRENQVKPIDPREVDIIAATHRTLRTQEPFLLISGYRTPRTNSHLRGAARNSYHIKGQAADLRLRSRSVADMSRAARGLKAGGVGSYYRSSFVHVDSGPMRTWRG